MSVNTINYQAGKETVPRDHSEGLRGKTQKKRKRKKEEKIIKLKRRTSRDVGALCVSQYYKLSRWRGKSSQR